MQEGSLRVDANINLHIDTPEGKVATPIVEVKNMNSFRAVERALDYEAERQYEVWQETGQTAGRRAQANPRLGRRGRTSRAASGSKEESSDYRYFPDPDLVPVTSPPRRRSRRSRRRWASCRPQLRERLEATYGISPTTATCWSTRASALVDYYVELAELTATASRPATGCSRTCCARSTSRRSRSTHFGLRPPQLAELLKAIQKGELDTSRAREVFIEMVETGQSAAEVMKAQGIEKVDESELVALCQELIAANPKIVADIKGGKQQAAGT